MLGVHAHAPHDPSRTSARGSCGRHRRSPLRPRSTHTPAMPSDATGGWPCLHPPCVSSRAHHPAHYSAHGHMQRRAYMRALAHVYMRNVAYAHSTSLTRHTCAHMRTCTCTQPDRPLHTHRRDITGKTHPDTHMHTRTHTQLPTYTHTHMNTCRYTKEHALIQTYAQTYTQTYTQRRTRPHTQLHTQTHRDRDRDGISHEQNAHRHTCKNIITHGCLHTHIHT